jgi:hypothetical protein
MNPNPITPTAIVAAIRDRFIVHLVRIAIGRTRPSTKLAGWKNLQ